MAIQPNLQPTFGAKLKAAIANDWEENSGKYISVGTTLAVISAVAAAFAILNMVGALDFLNFGEFSTIATYAGFGVAAAMPVIGLLAAIGRVTHEYREYQMGG